jgi:probable H4MPT-linked C1 transfer pathway protein
MEILALDIGGANLKAADGRGFAISRYFPLWKTPDLLAEALANLLRESPRSERLAVTMTGELADSFQTKTEGVRAILDAVEQAAAGRETKVYLTNGSLVVLQGAREQPLLAAASNWHALARFAGRFAAEGNGLLIDIGSTTSDIIPLLEGWPDARGLTDPERMVRGELVYTGVTRSPLCAVARDVPWRGERCPLAHELFATTWDAYLILGELPEEPQSLHTADGRPATKRAAHDRLARAICADREMFDERDALAAAQSIAATHRSLLVTAVKGVLQRMDGPPATVIVSGQGEFLARQLIDDLQLHAKVVSLSAMLGPQISQAATAHALAVLAREAWEQKDVERR